MNRVYVNETGKVTINSHNCIENTYTHTIRTCINYDYIEKTTYTIHLHRNAKCTVYGRPFK